MSFQSDYTLTATGFSLALPPIHQGVPASSYPFRMASPKHRRRVPLPHIARRGPRSFSRWLRRRSRSSQDSESEVYSTCNADYDIFQDDRFKPGLFFPHRAGPSVTFDEKTTVFYCSDEEQPGQEETVAAYVKEEGSLSDLEGHTSNRRELALPYKELYCHAPLLSYDQEDEDDL